MPVSYQIVPEHVYPHQYVQINDNTEVVPDYDSGTSDVTGLLCVFSSPKGRDREMYTINTGLAGFMDEYGIGPFATYGQPLMNAYAAARTGRCLVHCMRVTAEDAGYSYAIVNAYVNIYRYIPNEKAAEAADKQEWTAEDYAKKPTDRQGKEISPHSMAIKFFAETLDQAPVKNDIHTINDRATLTDFMSEEHYSAAERVVGSSDIPSTGVTTVTDQFVVPLFAVTYIGRGTFGDNIRIRIVSDKTSDKENAYKNYVFQVYDNSAGMAVKEEFHVSFVPDAISYSESIFAEDVINDDINGSNLVRVAVCPSGFKKIYEEYTKLIPDSELTEEAFDALLGVNKFTGSGIEDLCYFTEAGYGELPTEDQVTDEETSAETQLKIAKASPGLSLNSTSGVSLYGGSEGSLAANADLSNWRTSIPNLAGETPGKIKDQGGMERDATRQDVLDDLYYKAFSGDVDPYIRSKNHFPTTLILDANYPVAVKHLIASLTLQRTDCMCMLDCGTGIQTKDSVMKYIEANLDDYVNERVMTIEPYCMKVADPYSNKAVVVTSTYWLANRYPRHIYENGGKHRPLAGNRFGVIEDYIPNSVYPLFDEDLDSEIMDELAENHINFAKYNANQEICRAMQDTRQTKQTVLSEQNNMLIVLDIKRDAERISAQFEYEFSEPEDLARFNLALQPLVDKYASAQVRSIEAYYDKNDWEAQRNYIHLYIALVCKDLVRTTIIEIDVNRSSVTA